MLQDILYIESMKDYIKVVTVKETIITKQSISSVEAMLPEHQFIRTHRSFLVSAAAIHSYVEIARPMAKPEPDIPIKCSAEILEAIRDAPMAHQVSDPSARKKSLELVDVVFFF